MQEVIYETEVFAIGDMAVQLLNDEKLLVLFGAEAPEFLQEVCYKHNNNSVKKSIANGDIVKIDDKTYRVTSVGDVANQNLLAMGHCTLDFNVKPEADRLPGSIHLIGEQIPALNVGSKITVIRE
ncbi:PTS glucitol/sorbitol transporter subunit IIA [Propionispora vibrioides]|uniref:PTS system, glucitol/sorbitol-specific IIA component n=1 Tax=Propionispora vibrioides TaxID=112903 RepID=A0A1H8T5F0_9FIRM|nr:PTS glucitol/sorbitol transporter subunit IIA [Propionispora vibrioides]SEO86035.1 PTS system, glucitol/sorbitol-specific IIA component [Propionispora vibrioides]